METSRRAVLLALAGLAATPLLGCGKAAQPPALLTADGVSRRKPPADAPVAAAVEGLSAFGHNFLLATCKPGENYVASPLSLAVAFSMLRAGAAGVTAQELDAAFRFPASGRDAAFNALTGQLVTAETPPPPKRKERKAGTPPEAPVVSIGNALFPQKDFPIGQEFLRTLATDYGAGTRPVDFTGPEAVRLINAWASEQTAGRIKEVFQELSHNTKLVLANTVYFKADWEIPFTAPTAGPFTKEGGAVVQAKMMRRNGSVPYAEAGGVSAIELAYAAGPYAMWLMLPPKAGKPEDALRPEALRGLRRAFADTQVDIAVPGFDFETSVDLIKAMPGLGLASALGPGADFSGIAPGLFVDSAVHKANITVDEWGTEAAAVTAMGMAMSAPPQPTVTFHADRPFAFAIVGGPDRVPLFVGRVSDPS